MSKRDKLFAAASTLFPTGEQFQLKDLLNKFAELNDGVSVPEHNLRYQWNKLIKDGLIVECGISHSAENMNYTYWRDQYEGRGRFDARTRAYRVADPVELVKNRGKEKPQRQYKRKLPVEIKWHEDSVRPYDAYEERRSVRVYVGERFAGNITFYNPRGETWRQDSTYWESNYNHYLKTHRCYAFRGHYEGPYQGVSKKFKTLEACLNALASHKYRKED